MYNRYIPEDLSYTRVEPPARPRPVRSSPAPAGGARQAPVRLPDFLTGKEGLSGLRKALRLDRLDSGDILLLLIALYLFAEGDDPELAVALGAAVLMDPGKE